MFDKSSGQVYREWTVPRQSLTVHGGDRDWSRRRPYPLFTPRGTKGPRSLIDMATHVIANNIGDVTERHLLDAMPIRLLWRIWLFLEARGVCLHAWKLFSKILVADDEDKTLGLYRFRQHICHPQEELKIYTQPLMSPSTDFIAHLVISGGCQFSTHELLCLAGMKSLGVLELIQPADEVRASFPEVSDRLIRGWAEMENPFPLLRVLRIWRDQDATQESLRWVTKFPSLALYDVMASRDDWPDPSGSALEHGWEMAGSASGMEDSLLRYLMLFAPLEQIRSSRLRDLARRVDADLSSLCGDSRCAVKFVTDRQAPPLLDYLTDTANAYLPTWDIEASSRDVGSCHGIAFEAWAFWLYAFIGQLGGDEDLRSRGVQSDTQAVVGPFILPSKPFASLFLGHNGRGGITNTPSYVSRGLFATKRMTFTRPPNLQGRDEPPVPQKMSRKTANLAWDDQVEHSLRSKKRQRLDDILQSLSK
ncbi:hypothetical protein X797_000991 [Metarhizium robertsii]|uniref:Succinyl-3-ketoacid-coenzyme a transferase n=2 Tax=Metarhizium robertsii TaxID=568076 RepID=E9EWX7_METRA|nr:succinyl-3-ketoacid-coenzyme a transferase [Metarhizium robertsii ARSEF 23]EFY99597.2 succinyl-3-ketoacid-coenzyme a transferase [Metarhizium robertsii ARSEF 23]EXV06274.1 hypothetical protein X797_000991 [Metarhizium robertsii]